MTRRPRSSPLFPNTPLFGSCEISRRRAYHRDPGQTDEVERQRSQPPPHHEAPPAAQGRIAFGQLQKQPPYEEAAQRDRKSTRLNSSHAHISYAVFCLDKQKQ